ncbi:hypothetical protein H0E87_022415, partial [Populus deltoides]
CIISLHYWIPAVVGFPNVVVERDMVRSPSEISTFRYCYEVTTWPPGISLCWRDAYLPL